MMAKAVAFFQTGKGEIPRELADFLTCKVMHWDPETLERQPRLTRQMYFDFIMTGGLWR